MAKKSKTNRNTEPDSVFFLKLILFFIIGSVWLRFSSSEAIIPGIPVGLIVGVIFAHHDHFMIDRKIEFAVLLAAAFLSFVAPIGIVLQIR